MKHNWLKVSQISKKKIDYVALKHVAKCFLPWFVSEKLD